MSQRNEAPTHEILITREFNAPSAMVFKAWASVEQLSQWYAPRGCEVSYQSFDFREGGEFHSCIRSPEGHECWCRGIYLKIVDSSLIEFSMGIANAKGEFVDPRDVGMDPNWPRETIVTVTFVEQQGRTQFTLRQTVDESLAKRTGAYPSWIEMLDRLAERLIVQ